MAMHVTIPIYAKYTWEFSGRPSDLKIQIIVVVSADGDKAHLWELGKYVCTVNSNDCSHWHTVCFES